MVRPLRRTKASSGTAIAALPVIPVTEKHRVQPARGAHPAIPGSSAVLDSHPAAVDRPGGGAERQIPQLEVVGQMHSVSLAPDEAPSLQAMKRVGQAFDEFDSNSSAMVVLEGDAPLGQEAHDYYANLVEALRADSRHVQNVQDSGATLLTAGRQSADGKAAYVQIYLAGNQGRAAVQRVGAIGARYRRRLDSAAGCEGLRDRSGRHDVRPATRRRQGCPQDHRRHPGGHPGLMLLFVYRSIVTVALVLVAVGIQVAAARGVVALLGYVDAIGLSTFAVNLLTTMGIAAATDYVIFIMAATTKPDSTAKTAKPLSTPCITALLT